MVFRGRMPAVLAAALTCVAVASAAGAVPPRPVVFTSRTLANGLRVVVHEDRSTPVASVQVWVHAGAKDEPAGVSGVACLLERLMFKGSKNVDPDEHAKLVAAAGGQSGAYTTEDVTVYWNTVPSTHVPLALWLEADRLATVRIDRAMFEVERDILKEERRIEREQSPYTTLPELVYGRAFALHPYKRPTKGLTADLADLQSDKVRDFYRAYYVPARVTVVVAGDVEADRVYGLAQEYFGRIPTGDSRAVPGRPVEPRHAKPRRAALEEPWPLPVVVLAHPMPAESHPDACALRVAATVLAAGRASRLHRVLIERHDMAVSVGASARFAEDPGLFFVSAVVQPGTTPAEAEAALEAEVDLLRTAMVPDAELSRALTQLARDAALGRATVAQKAELLGRGAALHADPAFADAAASRAQTVTAADLQRVAQTYFVPTTRLTLTIRPKPASTEPVKRERR